MVRLPRCLATMFETVSSYIVASLNSVVKLFNSYTPQDTPYPYIQALILTVPFLLLPALFLRPINLGGHRFLLYRFQIWLGGFVLFKDTSEKERQHSISVIEVGHEAIISDPASPPSMLRVKALTHASVNVEDPTTPIMSPLPNSYRSSLHQPPQSKPPMLSTIGTHLLNQFEAIIDHLDTQAQKHPTQPYILAFYLTVYINLILQRQFNRPLEEWRGLLHGVQIFCSLVSVLKSRVNWNKETVVE